MPRRASDKLKQRFARAGLTVSLEFFTDLSPACSTRQSVKIGNFVLTWGVKIGYNMPMVREVILFVMRAGLVIGLWGLIWSVAEPKTQAMRILRATLLVLSLLGVWVLLSITGA
jgi:hypothetical protein